MGESRTAYGFASNRRGDRNATKQFPIPAERISFRDLARLAWRRKTEFYVSERTGADTRTVKRWMSRQSRAPDRALGIVLGEIMRRYG